MPFGTFAVVSPALTGGLTMLAPPILLMMLIAKTFLSNDGSRRFFSYAFTKEKALFLFAFWVIAIFVTLTMPRFFAGEVLVIPVRSDDISYMVPLEPTTQNFSQLVYLSISVLSVFMFAHWLRSPEMREHALKALCIGGLITVMTGFLDILSQYLPIDFFLEAFRNATYRLHTHTDVFNTRRVVGLMSEASTFGQVCMAFLTMIYFTRIGLKDDFYRDKLSPALIVLLMLMIWLSTSSAGYVGLGIFAVLALCEWVWRLSKSRDNVYFKRGLKVQAWILNGMLFAFLLSVLLYPSIYDPVITMVDNMVFQKTDTDSFEERTMWTAVSWQALLDSYGMGVGVGGTRASNGVVVMLSNVGFVAGACFYLFLLQLFLKKASKSDSAGEVIISAVKWSFIPSFIIDLLIATTPDFGAMNAFRFGLILAVAFSTVTLKSNQKEQYT